MAGCVCLVLRSAGVVGGTYTDTADTADKSTGASLSDSSPPISFSLVLFLSDSGSMQLCDVESLHIFPAFGAFLSSNFKAPGELACASFAFACICGSHPPCLWMLAGTGAGLKCISDVCVYIYSYLYMYTYIYMYTCIYIYIFICICMYIYTYIHMNICI